MHLSAKVVGNRLGGYCISPDPASRTRTNPELGYIDLDPACTSLSTSDVHTPPRLRPLSNRQHNSSIAKEISATTSGIFAIFATPTSRSRRKRIRPRDSRVGILSHTTSLKGRHPLQQATFDKPRCAGHTLPMKRESRSSCGRHRNEYTAIDSTYTTSKRRRFYREDEGHTTP